MRPAAHPGTPRRPWMKSRWSYSSAAVASDGAPSSNSNVPSRLSTLSGVEVEASMSVVSAHCAISFARTSWRRGLSRCRPRSRSVAGRVPVSVTSARRPAAPTCRRTTARWGCRSGTSGRSPCRERSRSSCSPGPPARRARSTGRTSRRRWSRARRTGRRAASFVGFWTMERVALSYSVKRPEGRDRRVRGHVQAVGPAAVEVIAILVPEGLNVVRAGTGLHHADGGRQVDRAVGVLQPLVELAVVLGLLAGLHEDHPVPAECPETAWRRSRAGSPRTSRCVPSRRRARRPPRGWPSAVSQAGTACPSRCPAA